MKKIEKKNYCSLVLLLVVTVFLTLSLARLYNHREDYTTILYKYSDKITKNEFDEFMMENSDAIIYIADKFDLDHDKFELKFKNKIEKLNLKNKLVYLDKRNIDKKILNNLKKNYGVEINLDKLPVILFKLDSKISKVVTVDLETDVEKIIDYEVFK